MNILYLNRVINIGGVSKCIIKLSKELKDENKIVVASQGGPLVHELEDISIKHYFIEDIEMKNFKNIIRNIKTISEIVRKENIEIIHSHHRMTTLIAKIISLYIPLKVVHTQHLCIEDKYFLTRIALNNINVITVSDAAKNILIEKCYLNPNKIHTIYNTIDTEINNSIIDNKLLHLKKQGYFIVAQVSRAVDYKGVYDFIEIAKLVTLNNKKIKFVFIGDGPELEEMQKQISINNLSDNILLLGNKTNVLSHLSYIDLMILCSYIEGLPLAPIEAFFKGIPVIGTNIGGTNEEIIEGYNGFLIEPKDIQGFADKITYLYNNKDIYINQKNNAYKTFIKMFNSSQYISAHSEYYKKLQK